MCSICLQVNRALRAFDRLETLAHLATVDEDDLSFNKEIYDRIFVAEQVEAVLQSACTSGAQWLYVKTDQGFLACFFVVVDR